MADIGFYRADDSAYSSASHCVRSAIRWRTCTTPFSPLPWHCLAATTAVIIADGDLVGMDGYAFTQELNSDPDLSGIPVIIVAGAPSEASALKARQSGAAAHLPMGIEIETLVQKVASLAAVPTVAAPATVAAAVGAQASAAGGGESSPQEPATPAGYGAPQAAPPGYVRRRRFRQVTAPPRLRRRSRRHQPLPSRSRR